MYGVLVTLQADVEQGGLDRRIALRRMLELSKGRASSAKSKSEDKAEDD